MKVLVGAFNQEKALVGAFSVIIQPVVEPMEHYTALNKATEQSGVLYAFPPCNFSLDLLRRVSGDMTDEGSKDDHLVVVVVKGG